jgi:D-alanine-D-alanine ligase
VPAFHGSYGEDGQMQGVFEIAGIPYTGMRTMASAILMDKGATKKFMQALDIPVLPYVVLKRPKQGLLIPKDQLAAAIKGFDFPCIIKPSHLGSSIGVAKVNNVDELAACLPGIFDSDDAAILEPYVQNLVEYNVAVSKVSGQTRTSAIERPKTTDELLDFKQKYLSGGGTKSGTKSGGTKSAGQISQGMLSLTRELNPALPAEKEAQIRAWSARMFEAIDGTGAPRIDYIGNSKTGEIWLNEVNPFPGSCGYFLWEALAEKPLLFTELISLMLEEALYEKGRRSIAKDPVPVDARLFKRG